MPYTYGPLVSDLYISSDTMEKQPTIILNMYNYASANIPNYNKITEIPNEYSPEWLNTSLAQDWSYAFSNCRNLISLPDPFYNTSNATNMNNMFYYCDELTIIPNFNTSNATNMSSMFSSCYYLTSIPNFYTSNVTDMKYMFSSCWSLTSIPNFDTSNVTDMGYMFQFCTNLTTIPNFNTSNVTDMRSMFFNCTNLTTVPNFDTSKVAYIGGIFQNTNLQKIPIINLANCISYARAFANCTNLSGDLYVENTRTYIYSFTNIFNGCNTYERNIYCHANTTTYNSIYFDLGNTTYNAEQRCYLKTMENDYAEIFPEPINDYSGVGSVYIVRFPTNKVQVCIPDISNSFIGKNVIEVTPYTDYIIGYDQSAGLFRINQTDYMTFENPWWTTDNPTPTTPGAPMFSFRFFKDIPNMTANVVDLL